MRQESVVFQGDTAQMFVRWDTATAPAESRDETEPLNPELIEIQQNCLTDDQLEEIADGIMSQEELAAVCVHVQYYCKQSNDDFFSDPEKGNKIPSLCGKKLFSLYKISRAYLERA